MWSRQSAGSCLEGNPSVSLDIGPQARVLDRFGEDFDGSAEGLRKSAFQPDQSDQVHAGGGIELGG